jgi:hypothetical protein
MVYSIGLWGNTQQKEIYLDTYSTIPNHDYPDYLKINDLRFSISDISKIMELQYHFDDISWINES